MLIVPIQETHGDITIQDGGGVQIPVYRGTGSLQITIIELDIKAKREGGWTVETGDGVACLVVTE